MMEPRALIPPTVGRIVLYVRWNGAAKTHFLEPLAAIVCKVHNDRCVNVGIFDENGVPNQNATSCVLVQPGDPAPEHSFVTWMPYQVGQAEKLDQTGRQLGGRVAQLEDRLASLAEKLGTPLAELRRVGEITATDGPAASASEQSSALSGA
jgi:hypothetical protein